ncbi:MAG TPA: YihY/virulence factor BrkB family protein [Cyanobacteria bacterium UBA8553]|nr:YihY/virulence factor BrkB family protein [Cyanobacteria bacterium UBA8553]HAJ58314.1 YihY/virulence factor BrkB family protein [Cyanobacteria bacterium UBA8543]
MNLKVIVGLLKETWKEWQEDKASRLAAALAYYTAFSIAPLFVIAIAIAAFVFGEEAAQGQIFGQLQGLVGTEAAKSIQALIVSSSKPTEGTIATLISIALLFFGASNVFTQLQDALNTIWEVAPKPGRGVKGIIKDRILSFGMVLGIGFLLLVSLILSTVLAGLGKYLGYVMPGLPFLSSILNFFLSFGVITLLFALIFKFLPDVKITWGDVGIGAVITALLFTIGKSLIGLYLGNSSVGSTYGAAGSFVVLLLWVNYSAQIILFGAEFTQVYANKYGSQIVPTKNAVPITEEARAQQGIPRLKDLETSANQDKRSQRATVENSVPQPSNLQPKRHPAAVVLAGLIGLYQGITSLAGTKGRKKNRLR